MVLVKGPLELAIKTRREPLSKNSAGNAGQTTGKLSYSSVY